MEGGQKGILAVLLLCIWLLWRDRTRMLKERTLESERLDKMNDAHAKEVREFVASIAELRITIQAQDIARRLLRERDADEMKKVTRR